MVIQRPIPASACSTSSSRDDNIISAAGGVASFDLLQDLIVL